MVQGSEQKFLKGESLKADVQMLGACHPWQHQQDPGVGVVLKLQARKEELNRAQKVQEVIYGGSPSL